MVQAQAHGIWRTMMKSWLWGEDCGCGSAAGVVEPFTGRASASGCCRSRQTKRIAQNTGMNDSIESRSRTMNGRQWIARSILVVCLIMGAAWMPVPAHAGTRVYVGFDAGGDYPYNGYTSRVHHRPPPPPRYGWWEPPPPHRWYRHHPPPYWQRECRPWHNRHHRWAHDGYDRW